jgi:ArsR family transcriptional regulator
MCIFAYANGVLKMTTQIDEFLKAAAEPTRLRILNLLRRGSVCVCDIQTILGLPQPAVSRHLALLRHVGLVLDRRQGNRILYSLAPATTPQMEALHQLVEACSMCEELLQHDLHMLDQALKQGQCAVSINREKEMLTS